MYLQNKYTKWYYNIINSAKSRTLSENIYTEKHHIIPKSLGGNNDKINIAILTAREHFICHCLLTKFTEGNNKRKMIFAFNMMGVSNKNKHKRYINAKLYEVNRKNLNESQKGKSHSNETCKKISKALKGRKHTKKSIKRMREASKGNYHSEKTKQKISKATKGVKNPNYGKSTSTETRKKQSDAHKNCIPWNKGRTDVYSDEILKKMSEAKKGKHASEETRKKLSEATKGEKNGFYGKKHIKIKCKYCDKEANLGNLNRWHNENCKNRP